MLRRGVVSFVCALLLSISFSRSEAMPMKGLTPVLVVESIEECLTFWVEQIGFEVMMKVPEGDKLGFVSLSRDGIELMLQSRASVAKDVPALAEEKFHTMLFIEVADLKPIQKAIEGMDLVFDARKTFYGSTEICLREPGGNVVTFAEFAQE
jgi:uncharacterized glyoxalase superfamily protein PhnB